MNQRESESSTRAIELLFFAPQPIWPVNTGARIRNYELARHLALRTSLTFAEMCQHTSGQQVLPDHSKFARIVSLPKDRPYSASKILRGLLGPTPVTLLNCWSARAASQLADLLRSSRFDTVQLEGVHLLNYLPIIRQVPGIPAIVVDWHNIESEMMFRYARTAGNWAKKLAAERTAELIQRAERRLLAIPAIHTVTSERERKKLLEMRPDAKIYVIPNGIDTKYYEQQTIAEGRSDSGSASKKRTLLFVGSMDYHANIDAVTWFIRTVWPGITRAHPEIHFMIVGRDPVPEVRALASDRIHVSGTVDDVRPFYADASVVIVPIRSGSGTRIKILEAMAAGVPVVSTRLGAEGMEVEDNVHLLLADTAQEIAAAISQLLSSAESRIRLTQAARTLVCNRYDWSTIGNRLYGIHKDLVFSRTLNSVQKVS